MGISRKRGGNRLFYCVIIIVLLLGYCGFTLERSIPGISPTISLATKTTTPKSQLVWPAQGQAAVGVVGTKILDMHGEETPVPTASTAKLITALTVLQKKPLQAGEQGPTITLNSNDAAIYSAYAAQDGSVVKVQAGEQISEYQMLQTLMLPSANNMADSLAIWAFGSLKDYQQAANQYLESLGLVTTHVGSDASGLSPSTTSTAHDMVQIGELAMQNPVLSQIVGQTTASGIPIVGDIKNVNLLLGTAGIVGIKTGNSDSAGGAFVSAAKTTVNGKPVTIVTALLGSANLWQALHDSVPLIKSVQQNFPSVELIKQGEKVGYYRQPWGGTVNAVADKTIAAQVWAGSTVNTKIALDRLPSKDKRGDIIGSVTLPKSALNDQVSAAIKTESTPTKPSAWWRLTHPF